MSGSPVTVIGGTWGELGAPASSIRHEVFVVEQGVPAEIELDEWDASAFHVVAFADGVPVATGRLLPDGHLGRVAVLRAWRGKGVGRSIMEALLQRAASTSLDQILLNAQQSAVDFYRSLGFQEAGDMFIEAGIPHLPMRLILGTDRR